MVENVIEILVILGAAIMLVKACRAIAQHGNLDEIKQMVGEGLLLPYAARRRKSRKGAREPEHTGIDSPNLGCENCPGFG